MWVPHLQVKVKSVNVSHCYYLCNELRTCASHSIILTSGIRVPGGNSTFFRLCNTILDTPECELYCHTLLNYLE